MIITQKKPPEEILSLLSGAKKIALIGCGQCASACQTGGEKELGEMKAFLEEKKAVGIHIRRGDVLEPKYVREIGGICGYEYYRKARFVF